MSGFMNLCECLCRQLQRHLDSIESIMQQVGGSQTITAQGSAAEFGLRPRDGGLSPTTLLAMLFIVLFLGMIMSMGRNRRREALPEKPNPQADPSHRPPPSDGGAY